MRQIARLTPRPKLELRGVGLAFGKQRVLRDISLEIHAGETVVVIGESGCGKTQLLKSMVRLVVPTEGEIYVDGQPLGRLSERQVTRLRLRFGFVFQMAALFDSLNIYENIAFSLREHTRLGEMEIRDAVRQRLREVGLSTDIVAKKPAELSGGMRKRVGLARAIALDPEVMLYDEPTTGLDPIMSDVINELILATRDVRPVTSVVVTHDMKSALKIASRIVMLYPIARLSATDPQIIFDGTPEEIKACADPRVCQFVRGEARERLSEDSA